MVGCCTDGKPVMPVGALISALVEGLDGYSESRPTSVGSVTTMESSLSGYDVDDGFSLNEKDISRLINGASDSEDDLCQWL